MFATVRIPTPATRSALAIPANAVQNVDGAAVAFVKAAGDRFEKRLLQPWAALRRLGRGHRGP